MVVAGIVADGVQVVEFHLAHAVVANLIEESFAVERLDRFAGAAEPAGIVADRGAGGGIQADAPAAVPRVGTIDPQARLGAERVEDRLDVGDALGKLAGFQRFRSPAGSTQKWMLQKSKWQPAAFWLSASSRRLCSSNSSELNQLPPAPDGQEPKLSKIA